MRTVIFAAIAALAVAGCSKEEHAPETQSTAAPQGEPTTGGETGTPTATEAATSAACPMKVQGTTVQAENVEGGAALIFMTTGDVDDLRERVRHFAAMQEAGGMRGDKAGMTGMMRPGGSDAASAKSAEPMSNEQRGNGSTGGVVEQQQYEAMGGGGGMSDETHAMPQVNTRVEDIEGGARMVIIPMDSGDLADVRMQVEGQAQTMAAGECPMGMPSTSSTY